MYAPSKERLVCMNINLEEYLMPIEFGLPAKIYLHAYEKPKSSYEISFEIYDKYHHGINTIIKKLNPEGYFLPVSIEGKKHPKWISSVEPLVSMIEYNKKQQNIVFSDLEKHIIRKVIDSEAFRSISSNQYIYQKIRGDFNAVEFLLIKLDCLAIEYLKSKALCRLGTILDVNIKNIEQYDRFIEKTLTQKPEDNVDNFISNFIEYQTKCKKEPIPPLIDNKKLVSNIMKEYDKLNCCFYVPKTLMDKIKGVSEFGHMATVYDRIIAEAQELDNIVNFVVSKKNIKQENNRKVKQIGKNEVG